MANLATPSSFYSYVGPAKVSRHEEPATTAKVMDDIQLTQGKHHKTILIVCLFNLFTNP